MPFFHHPAESSSVMPRVHMKGETREAATSISGLKSTNSKIIDIRREKSSITLADDINSGLRPADHGSKSLPTLLLYDEAGLKIFEEITYLKEYYLTEEEIQVLETHADDIAKCFKPNSVILELGSGNLRKINILLKAVERIGTDVEYYALDLSLPELERTLSAIDQTSFKHVKLSGLHGTYDDGLEWLQSPCNRLKSKSVLSMGSSIGNFNRLEAAKFVKYFIDTLGPGDTMLIGIDACKDADKVYHAYNDCKGVTHRFVLNGLVHANRILGTEDFDINKWHVIGEYDAKGGRHHASVCPTEDVQVAGVLIKANEKVHIEDSYKYSSIEAAQLWDASGVAEIKQWLNHNADYGIHLISKNNFSMPLNLHKYATTPAPSWQEWLDLWKIWDTVTQSMIPKEELLSKPIKLRNACIFYLGHIPTFADMKIVETLKIAPTEPAYYPRIFERGIDPDVDNPEHVHAHSEIPEEWPPVGEILAFQDRVRKRIQDLYTANEQSKVDVGRCLWLGYEHECMHLETLLYMLIQSDKTIAPPTGMPDFEAMARKAKAQAVPNEWITIPPSDISLGLDDLEKDFEKPRYYGWDIEKPSRTVHVKGFSAKARPITNGEYAYYLEHTKNQKIPAAWSVIPNTKGTTNGFVNGTVNGMDHSQKENIPKSTMNGTNQAATNGVSHQSANGTINEPTVGFIANKYVKTVYGPISLSLALEWPVSASYDELAACAAYLGGRIPTLEEARSIYSYAELSSSEKAQNTLNTTTPAVNSHLLNDGVEESPPHRPSLPASAEATPGLDPGTLFADLQDCNIGFQHWHPMPVSQNGSKLSGLGEMGGVWEWTSSELQQHAGYEPMSLYPVYSSDFFDGKHNVILGGSWATAPRLAGRKSFVNWYQRNYPYMWAGARIVRDL